MNPCSNWFLTPIIDHNGSWFHKTLHFLSISLSWQYMGATTTIIAAKETVHEKRSKTSGLFWHFDSPRSAQQLETASFASLSAMYSSQPGLSRLQGEKVITLQIMSDFSLVWSFQDSSKILHWHPKCQFFLWCPNWRSPSEKVVFSQDRQRQDHRTGWVHSSAKVQDLGSGSTTMQHRWMWWQDLRFSPSCPTSSACWPRKIV